MYGMKEYQELKLKKYERFKRFRVKSCRSISLPVKNMASGQWRNEAPGAPATPGGAVIGGRQIVIKMWDNFARLTALLAKVRVWLNNSTIYLDFSAIFSEIAPRKMIARGRHWGALFGRRGAPCWLCLLRYATASGAP